MPHCSINPQGFAPRLLAAVALATLAAAAQTPTLAPNAATFTIGNANTVTVTASGSPAPTLTYTGSTPALPSSIPTPTVNNATFVLSGTPSLADAGQYTLSFTAPGAPSPLKFTLTVQVADVLSGMGFGAAVGFQYNLFHKTNIISSATIDADGYVRINRANAAVGLMLESHYLFVPKNHQLFGWGPFVGVVPGSQNLIDAAGAGMMFAWRHSTTAKQGWGLGVGYESIPSAQTLGDEFVNDEPAPTGPDGKTPLPLRIETRDKGSLLVIFSVVF